MTVSAQCLNCSLNLHIAELITYISLVFKLGQSFLLQDRPVIIARTQYIREHRLYEVVGFAHALPP